MSKLVSVIIPSYKRPIGLKKAIDSVLNQTYENIEIIIVDDNNPNTEYRKETEDLMMSYKDYKNIIYIQHTKNRNGSAARNTGIRAANGDYIALLDNDDEFLPNKISLQTEKLENIDNSYGVVYTKFIRKRMGKVIEYGIENVSGTLTKEILQGSIYISAGSNILIKRTIVDQIFGFDESLQRRQDLDFLARASLLTNIAHVNEYCLVIHRDDRSNAKALTNEEDSQANKKYLHKFKKYIEGLPENEQKKIKNYHSLQEFRKHLMKGRVKDSLRLKKKDDLSLFLITKYSCYLIKRKVLKQCYGFKM